MAGDERAIPDNPQAPAVPDPARVVPEEVRERIRLAIIAVCSEKGPDNVNMNTIRYMARATPRHVSLLVDLWRKGLMPELFWEWHDHRGRGGTAAAPVGNPLHAAVAGATSLEAVATAARDVALARARGELERDVATDLLKALDLQRKALEGRGDEEQGREGAETWHLASVEACEVARAVDLLSETPRERVLALVRALLAADLERDPDVDSGGAS